MRGGIMICGTASDAGKSTVVAALCRLLKRRGVSVAPFKAQNMALNSAVTPSGHEIGRAQAAQAQAAGVDPEVSMNPILLKPSSEMASQVVVLGRPWADLDAAAYQRAKLELLPVVEDALAGLRRRFDVVVCEGAGSPAEINLLDGDMVNLGLAKRAGLPALVVGDIDRGGVFAALYGTVALLPGDLRAVVRGFVINKLRGDPALLGAAPAELERRCGVPTVGVLPWISAAAGLDAEDSLGLGRWAPPPVALGKQSAWLDVAVVSLPRIENFTDLEPLALEPGVRLRLVGHPGDLGSPDLVVLPGSKATVADLAWLGASGLAGALRDLAGKGATLLGICAGYQMLGRRILDPLGVESGEAVAHGLGLLPVETVFETSKVTRLRSGTALGQRVSGYEIYHGRTAPGRPWIALDEPGGGQQEPEGSRVGGVFGTNLHGLFEEDGFRSAFLLEVAERSRKPWSPGGVSFPAAREERFEMLADLLEAHLDIAAVERLIEEAAS